MKSTLLLGLIAVAALVVAVLAGASDGPAQASSSIEGPAAGSVLPAQVPPGPHYYCYDVTGGHSPNDAAVLDTQFGREDPNVLTADRLCTPAAKINPPIPAVPHLYCYHLSVSDNPPDVVNLTTQFTTETNVAVEDSRYLCAPTDKTLTLPHPAPVPSTEAHYKCYDIVGHNPPDQVTIFDQFFPPPLGDLGVLIEQATLLCAPAGKNLAPIPNVPHLKCYNVIRTGAPIAAVQVFLQTQFGPDQPVRHQPQQLCAPVIKEHVAVGGIAEVPGEESAPVPRDEGGGGLGAGAIAAIAAAAGMGALALASGGWYARRRLLR